MCSPLVPAFAEEHFRRCLPPQPRQLAKFGSQRVERRLNLGGERLTENFPMFGLG
jgi:hypothetical protein